MSYGISLGSKKVSLGNISIQPVSQTTTSNISISQVAPVNRSQINSNIVLTKAKVSPESVFSKIALNKNTNILFDNFSFGIIKALPIFIRDTRYNDNIPAATNKFTPYEELSGISSARPEIITISEFKPLFVDGAKSETASGKFLDAQVQLMNLRQQTIVSLINDLKKDQELSEQLDQQEGNFLLHVKNLKTKVNFLQNVQDSIQLASKPFDLRDSTLNIDLKVLLSQYFRPIFDDVNQASKDYSNYNYHDLLVSHGFSKNRVRYYTGTKLLLQAINESKKMLRAGSDELLGIDPSIIESDSNPVTINKRIYKDPHNEFAKVDFPTISDVVNSKIHSSDSKLVSVITSLKNGFSNLDSMFDAATNEELAYTAKIKLLSREFNYSKSLSDNSTVELIKQFGYTVSDSLGNEQLFDAVYGQIGNRITDDRSNINQNTISSTASKNVDNISVLTFESDYLENDEGSIYTPGTSYYINSVVKPSDSGFSLTNPFELITKFNSVVDKYVDFLGRFNILPKQGNRINSQNATEQLVSDPIVTLNTLYEMYIERSNGLLKNDVKNNNVTSFFNVAARDHNLRANLFLYVYCATNVGNDGIVEVGQVKNTSKRNNIFTSNSVTDLSPEEAKDKNVKVSATLDKIIKNCVQRYKLITNDDTAASDIEKSLRNFSEKSIISRMVSFVSQIFNIFYDRGTAISANGLTKYSGATDVSVIALALQLVLDSSKRYSYNDLNKNKAFAINSNYSNNISLSSKVQSSNKQSVSSTTTSNISEQKGVQPVRNQFTSNVLGSNSESKLSLLQAIESRLIREEQLTIKSCFAPLNAIKSCKESLEKLVIFLQNNDSVNHLNEILKIVGDRKLVELLGERGQVQIMSDIVDDMISRIEPNSNNSSKTDIVDVISIQNSVANSDDLKIFDDSFITSRTANVIKAAFSDSSFDTSRGSNIRVLSVGLPHAFSNKLKNSIKTSNFAEQMMNKPKQNDVIILDIYKIDVRYPDLVFKPISKVFELSRFCVRDEKQFLSTNVGNTLDKTLASIPTKDYSNFSNPIITYGDSITNDNNYSFMSHQDSSQMIKNHVMSFLLETYFRIMTGIPTSERELYISDPDDKDIPAPFIAKALINKVAEKVFEIPVSSDYKYDLTKFLQTKTNEFQVFSNKVPIAGGISMTKKLSTGSTKNALMAVKSFTKLVGHASVISDISKKRTVYSDTQQTSKNVLSPKMFERIFFLSVDPDDYEIDYNETVSSTSGRSTFDKLREANEIQTTQENVGFSTREIYKMKDLKNTQKELVFEKYFVTIRSYTPLPQRNFQNSKLSSSLLRNIKK